MLYLPNGEAYNPARRGRQVDGYQLPDGAIVSSRFSRDFQNRLRNDTKLRERIEQADRESFALRHRRWEANGKQGKEPKFEETEHLALLRRSNTAATPEAVAKLEKHQAFGEAVMKDRIKTEKLPASEAGYHGLQA